MLASENKGNVFRYLRMHLSNIRYYPVQDTYKYKYIKISVLLAQL